MIHICDFCNDRTDILDGYHKEAEFTDQFNAQHGIGQTLTLKIEYSGKPTIHIPKGMNKAALRAFMAMKGMHTNSIQMGTDTIRIPRGGKLPPRMLAQELQAQGFRAIIQQEYRTDPDSIECTHNCSNASIDSSYCRCSCGGDNHSARAIGNYLRHFHCTIEKIKISDEIMIRQMTMEPAKDPDSTLRKLIHRFR